MTSFLYFKWLFNHLCACIKIRILFIPIHCCSKQVENLWKCWTCGNKMGKLNCWQLIALFKRSFLKFWTSFFKKDANSSIPNFFREFLALAHCDEKLNFALFLTGDLCFWRENWKSKSYSVLKITANFWHENWDLDQCVFKKVYKMITF